jgi:hypothetical protein
MAIQACPSGLRQGIPGPEIPGYVMAKKLVALRFPNPDPLSKAFLTYSPSRHEAIDHLVTS